MLLTVCISDICSFSREINVVCCFILSSDSRSSLLALSWKLIEFLFCLCKYSSLDFRSLFNFSILYNSLILSYFLSIWTSNWFCFPCSSVFNLPNWVSNKVCSFFFYFSSRTRSSHLLEQSILCPSIFLKLDNLFRQLGWKIPTQITQTKLVKCFLVQHLKLNTLVLGYHYFSYWVSK